MSEMIIGGLGQGIRLVELDECHPQSILLEKRSELAERLGIDAEFAKFVDQYHQEKLENLGVAYAPRIREACSVAIVNFLGLPDVMGKHPFLDLRDTVTRNLMLRELHEATRDESHAENLYERRIGELYMHTIITLTPDELTTYNDQLEIYFEGMEAKATSGRRALGRVAISSR